jgi:hypothetical protein
MSRPKGVKNKSSKSLVITKLPTKERIDYLAAIIVERIIDDRNKHQTAVSKNKAKVYAGSA